MIEQAKKETVKEFAEKFLEFNSFNKDRLNKLLEQYGVEI